MSAGRAGVLFDVDGTLVDSAYLHALAWWRACHEAGLDISMARIHRLIGMGSDHLLQALVGENREDLSEAHGRQMETLRSEFRAFPAVPELLRELSSRGATVVLATSAKESELPKLRDVIGADDAIDEITASGDVERSKPSPDIFAVAMERSGLDARRALAVGDTRWDVEASGKLGVGCVALLTGGWSRAELLEAGAIAVYEDPAELLRRLDESPIGALLRESAGAAAPR